MCHGFVGPIYEDGSCSSDVFRELRRAGWGVVAVDAFGMPLYRIYGTATELPICRYI